MKQLQLCIENVGNLIKAALFNISVLTINLMCNESFNNPTKTYQALSPTEHLSTHRCGFIFSGSSAS